MLDRAAGLLGDEQDGLQRLSTIVGPQHRWRRLAAPLLTGVGLAAATVALRLRDPHVDRSWGFCPVFTLTGIYCPGCGGLRAVNDLTHGEILDAARSNLLFVAFVPLIIALLVGWTLASWRGRTFAPRVVGDPRFGYLMVALLVTFTVVRNLPGMTILQP